MGFWKFKTTPLYQLRIEIPPIKCFHTTRIEILQIKGLICNLKFNQKRFFSSLFQKAYILKIDSKSQKNDNYFET